MGGSFRDVVKCNLPRVPVVYVLNDFVQVRDNVFCDIGIRV
jgi:hypothetical protein